MTFPFPKADRALSTTLGDPRAVTLWAGRGENLRAGRRGRRPARYRLTSSHLYLDDRSGAAAPRRISVAAIGDVFVRQDPVQRQRGTGDLTVLTSAPAATLHDVSRPLAVRVLLLSAARRALETPPPRPEGPGGRS
ncbi:MAG TPA: hypothetical protein VLR26_15170 [Frankiaceae bacterium]|nr:hypothetical protein [Frankiaceae bacterium]